MDQKGMSGTVGDGFLGPLAQHGVDHHDAAVVIEGGDDAVPSVQVKARLLHVGHPCGNNELMLTKNTGRIFWKKVQQNGPSGREKKDQTERVLGLGRRTREEIVKWNQMTALRFQTGGETSDILGLPSGAKMSDTVRNRRALWKQRACFIGLTPHYPKRNALRCQTRLRTGEPCGNNELVLLV